MHSWHLWRDKLLENQLDLLPHTDHTHHQERIPAKNDWFLWDGALMRSLRFSTDLETLIKVTILLHPASESNTRVISCIPLNLIDDNEADRVSESLGLQIHTHASLLTTPTCVFFSLLFIRLFDVSLKKCNLAILFLPCQSKLLALTC